MRAGLLALLLLLAGCTAPQPAAAEAGRIDGAVLAGQFAEPVGNATVELVEAKAKARTSEFGGFSFTNVQPGTYTLRVVMPGMGADEETVEVRPQETTRIILQMEGPAPPAGEQHSETRIVTAEVASPNGAAAPHECLCWRTTVDPEADSLSLDAQWYSRASHRQAYVIVTLHDAAGNLISEPLRVPGIGSLRSVSVGPANIPENGEVQVRVRFPEGLLPEPQFSMETRVRTYKAPA